ncbi:endonuclease, partial [Arthrospira platensis SPKY1]|nr:endonuclease [Arthrospira platensis SPKY1]
FEPREAVKGAIARAMFYFYTMYREEADAADPDFFRQQVQTLCQWHRQAPPDARELARTRAIARHQDGKPNPFVLDASLAERAFCE